jgi:hypothetical protein
MKRVFNRALLSLGLSLVLASGAHATTFSQFDLGTGLTFMNSGAASTLSETSQVNLTCLDPACAGVGTAATLTLSAAVSGPAGSLGPFDIQPLGAGTLTVTLNTPYMGASNFLVIGFSGASIAGFDGDSNFSITSSGSTTFSSDFLKYTNVGFQLTASDADPGLFVDANGYLQSFTSDPTGSFFGTPSPVPVPLPPSLALFGTGVAGLGLVCLLRRRKERDQQTGCHSEVVVPVV